jgi:hypothetical protein
MSLYDTRSCTRCGRMGVTRPTCPSCPCSICKKEGHIADNCDISGRHSNSNPKARSSHDASTIAAGPLSNPYLINKPRRQQPRLTSKRSANPTRQERSVGTEPATGDFSPVHKSNSSEKLDLQHQFPQRSNSSPKRKMDSEFDDVRKRTMTRTTTLGQDGLLIPAGSRESDSIDVSPILNPEVSSREG